MSTSRQILASENSLSKPSKLGHMLNKVPEITIVFWLIKMMSTTVGETAADFMLQGSVTTIVDTAGREQVRTYQVDMQLIDLETNKIIWSDQNNDIKKYIKKSAVKF